MIYDWYDLKAPAASLFHINPGSTVDENPFNSTVIVAELDEYWDGEVEFNNMNYDQAVALRSWMNRLRGPVGQFWFKDYAHKQRSTWAGSPVVDGANQDGTLLKLRNFTPDIVLLEGDRFQLGDFLYELTTDIQVSSSGLADVEFLPDIRFIPADGENIITDNPMCKCMLYPDQKPPRPTTKQALITDFKFKFRESLRD